MYEKVARAQYDTIPMVTSLPSGADNGDRIVLTDSLTAGTYHWLLQYVAARASNKWVYIGGASIFNEVTAAQATTATHTNYQALATAGPSIAVPVAGDYEVALGFTSDGASTNTGLVMSYDIGGSAAVDADAVMGSPSNTAAEDTSVRHRRKSGLTAVTLTAKYKSTSAAAVTFQDRWMSLLPIAIGG